VLLDSLASRASRREQLSAEYFPGAQIIEGRCVEAVQATQTSFALPSLPEPSALASITLSSLKVDLSLYRGSVIGFHDGSAFACREPAHSHDSCEGALVAHDGSVKIGLWRERLFKQGLHVLSDGSWFVGSEEMGDREGVGMEVNVERSIVYFGEWKRGAKHGKGKEVHGEEEFYEGEFLFGRREGKGHLQESEKRYWKGMFKDGVIDGQGEEVNGDVVYKGEFIRGKWHGEGILKEADGREYEGEFADGMRSGKGKQRW